MKLGRRRNEAAPGWTVATIIGGKRGIELSAEC
jgi:hypothetical protein